MDSDAVKIKNIRTALKTKKRGWNELDQENVAKKTLSLFARRRQDTGGKEGATERERRLTTKEPKAKRTW